MTPEEELRDRLRGLAERAGQPSARGPDLARRIARDSADRRRRHRNLLVGVACVVLLGVTVPRLDGTGSAPAVPASGSASAPGPAVGASAAAEDAGILGGATRGSLAGDRAFVEGVRALSWLPGRAPVAANGIPLDLPDPPLETRSVVFAGEVFDDRWALVVGRASSGNLPPDQPVAAWFAGPADAGPTEMALRSGPNGIAPDWPLAVTDPRTGALVVVAAPGDVVEVSDRPEIGADGTTTREWEAVETVDGIAITRVPPSVQPYDLSTSYRVFRDGRIEARDMPWSFFYDEPGAPLPIEYPRGRPSAVGEQAARYAAEHVLGELGLSPGQVHVTAHWVGSVPAGGPGQAAVVTVTVPSGAVVVEAQAMLPEAPDGAVSGAFCGQALLPAGPPVDRLVHALSCELSDSTTGATTSTSLVVVGPPEVALIRAYDNDRTFIGEHAAVDGIVVVPLPPGTDTVEAVTAAGVTLGRVELLGHAVDFGD